MRKSGNQEPSSPHCVDSVESFIDAIEDSEEWAFVFDWTSQNLLLVLSTNLQLNVMYRIFGYTMDCIGFDTSLDSYVGAVRQARKLEDQCCVVFLTCGDRVLSFR